MDIVYLVKNSVENDSEELRYSLRSLKNIPHGTVYIVGEKPDWVTNVTFIEVPQLGLKNANWEKSLRTAAAREELSEEFIMMNDDFVIMKPIDAIPLNNFGPMADVIAHYDERYPDGNWYADSLRDQYNVLTKKGFTNLLSYELHAPLVLNKNKVLQLYREVTEPLGQFRSYYGNYFHLGGVTVPDVKIFMVARHNDPRYNEDPEAYLKDQTFLSSTGGAFKADIPGGYVRALFPEKSEYEL